jgi:Flp pilus assembly protein TadD
MARAARPRAPKGSLTQVKALYAEVWKDTSKWTANFGKATRMLKSMLAERPDDTRALTCLGAIYSDQGRHREALEILRKAARLGSTDRNLYMNIAIAMMNLESQRSGAMRYFRKAGTLSADRLTFEAYFDPQGH